VKDLTLVFAISLTNHDIPDPVRPQGALFNRWLPNGKEDSIVLSADSDSARVEIWFERHAIFDGTFLHWARNGTEFDEATMRRQGRLDGGHLRGEIKLHDVPESAFIALRKMPIMDGQPYGQDVRDVDPDYVALAKRVVRCVDTLVVRFVKRLRTQYGQYWLRDLSPWDSRVSSLGAHCASLGLRWWNDETKTNCRFLPDNLSQTFRVVKPPGRGYGEYLTEADWRYLQEERCAAEVSIEMELLGNATRLLDHGEYRQSFVDVVTALEVVISNHLKKQARSVQSAMQHFVEGPLNTQVAVLFGALKYRESQIEDTLRVIKVRNEIVHEGMLPKPDDVDCLRRVVRLIGLFAGMSEVKMPFLDGGNSLSPPGVQQDIQLGAS
jgi:hypothetical protein